MSIRVLDADVEEEDVDDCVYGGRKTPLVPNDETWKSANSRLVSIVRLPAPWGVGGSFWVLEEGGIWQPIEMPWWVEK